MYICATHSYFWTHKFKKIVGKSSASGRFCLGKLCYLLPSSLKTCHPINELRKTIIRICILQIRWCNLFQRHSFKNIIVNTFEESCSLCDDAYLLTNSKKEIVWSTSKFAVSDHLAIMSGPFLSRKYLINLSTHKCQKWLVDPCSWTLGACHTAPIFWSQETQFWGLHNEFRALM